MLFRKDLGKKVSRVTHSQSARVILHKSPHRVFPLHRCEIQQKFSDIKDNRGREPGSRAGEERLDAAQAFLCTHIHADIHILWLSYGPQVVCPCGIDVHAVTKPTGSVTITLQPPRNNFCAVYN